MRFWQGYRCATASLLLLGVWIATLPAHAEQPSGTYRAQGISPTGKPYAGVVEILPQGQGAHLAWQLDGGARYLGLGLRLDGLWAPPELADPVKIRFGRETLRKEDGSHSGAGAMPSDCTAQSAALNPR